METAIIYTQPFGVECVIKPTVQKTATGTSQHVLQRPEDDINETQVNVLLQDFEFSDTRVRTGQLIRRERHCDVYSVFIDEDGSRLDERAEARAFIVDGVPPKLRRYRIHHCLDRLKSSALFIATFHGAMVIVNEIRPDDKFTIFNYTFQLNEIKQFEKETVKFRSSEDSEPAKRVRQRERRRVDRRRKAENTPPEDPPFPNQTPEVYMVPSWFETQRKKLRDNIRRASELYSLYNDRGDARRHDINRKLGLFANGNENTRLPITWEQWLPHSWNGQPKKERSDESRKRLRNSLDNQMKLLESLEQIQKDISEVSYQELSLGIQAALSDISREELQMDSRNHRLEILRWIQPGLPNLLRRVEAEHKLTKDEYEKWMLEDNLDGIDYEES